MQHFHRFSCGPSMQCVLLDTVSSCISMEFSFRCVLRVLLPSAALYDIVCGRPVVGTISYRLGGYHR